MNNIEILANKLGVKVGQVEAVLKLLEEGATIPFIARYRKEMTGSLDEEQIREIDKEYTYLENLLKRKEDVIRLIEEKDLMTDELRVSILACEKLSDVEDLYRPFKEKKKTKASEAIKMGLEPLAKKIMKIVYENIIFAIAIKLVVLVLGALGYANMWLAIFADVGVACLCIINA